MGKRRTRGEGSIYYDPNRRRWIGETTIDGRRRRVSGKTKTDASGALGKLIHGDEAERQADKRVTVKALLADWREKALSGRHIAPSTRGVHEWAAGLLTDELGRMRVADLDVLTVEKALGRLARGSQGKPLSRSSIVKVRNTLRQALAWAERRRAVTHNAAAVAELPTDLPEAGTRRALTADELKRLFKAAEEHTYGAMFVIMGTVGLRPGEAAGLRIDGVDLDAGTITVASAVQLDKGRPSVTTELKTPASRRTIALPSVTAAALRLHGVKGKPTSLLFPGPKGGPVWPSTMRAELRHLCAAAGVPVVRPNELRHSAATLMADSGLELYRVADVLGQTSTRMLGQTYRHRPAVVRGAEAVDAALRP